jgi:hypothetical protein
MFPIVLGVSSRLHCSRLHCPYCCLLAALIVVIFAGSCCCCSIVFISAEASRVKEGMTFQEAYLIPIPLVSVDTNFDDKAYPLPAGQPTAIATAHNNIDIPVAEPTEHSAFLGFYPERNFVWD